MISVKHSIQINECKTLGQNLIRPESVIVDSNGNLIISNLGGGYTQINPITQEQKKVTPAEVDEHSTPNGLTCDHLGNIVIADFGLKRIDQLSGAGDLCTILPSEQAAFIGRVNHVQYDSLNRLWFSVSTLKENWLSAISPDYADGYVGVYDGEKVVTAASNLKFPNEIRLDKNEEYLYISETAGRCIKRGRINSEGLLSDIEVYGPDNFGLGGFPDGITFDYYGNLWVALIGGEKIVAITPSGQVHEILSDINEQAATELDDAFFGSNLTEGVLLKAAGQHTCLVTSIAFGGSNNEMTYLGSLLGSSILSFKTPIIK